MKNSTKLTKATNYASDCNDEKWVRRDENMTNEKLKCLQSILNILITAVTWSNSATINLELGDVLTWNGSWMIFVIITTTIAYIAHCAARLRHNKREQLLLFSLHWQSMPSNRIAAGYFRFRTRLKLGIHQPHDHISVKFLGIILYSLSLTNVKFEWTLRDLKWLNK